MFLDSICFNNNQLQLNNSWHVLLYCRCLCSVWLGTCFFAPRARYASELQTASVPSFKFDCEGRLNQRTTQSKALCTTWHATTLGLDQVVANLLFACLILPEKMKLLHRVINLTSFKTRQTKCTRNAPSIPPADSSANLAKKTNNHKCKQWTPVVS